MKFLTTRVKSNAFAAVLGGIGFLVFKFIGYWSTSMEKEISQLWTDSQHINHIFRYLVEDSPAVAALVALFNDLRSPKDKQGQEETPPQPTPQPPVAPQPQIPGPVIELVEPLPPVVQQARPLPQPLIDMERLYAELKRDEGIRHVTYRDSRGFMTAGIGHLLRPDEPEYDLPEGSKVSDERVISWFKEDVEEAINNVQVLFPEFKQFPMDVRLVLVNMVFQLGYTGLSRFKKTIYYLRLHDWAAAADEMLDSKWAKQTPKRAQRHANRIRAFADMDVELA